MTVVPEPLTVGTLVGARYRLVRELARGGMATVWVACDEVLSRDIAIKILDPSLGRDAGTRTRFRNEAIAAARISHPGIVATYDSGDDNGVAFIVMELIEGETLREVLDKGGRLPIDTAVGLGVQIAEALSRAHSQGFIHRDIKPGNLLIQADGRVRIADFGIAKSIGGIDLTRDGTVMGTARYLSPEQLGGRPADARSDVYALGLVLYEMLAGSTPFNGDTEMATALARLSTDPTPIRTVRPSVPAGLEQVLHQALAREPDDRFSSASELRDAIAPFAGAGTSTPAHGVVLPNIIAATTRSVRGKGPQIAFSLCIVVLLVLVLLLTRGGTNEKSQATSTPLRAIAAHDFDPQGDGREHPELVSFLIDNDVATTWRTERYHERNFSGDKPGVGFVLDLGAEGKVNGVAIDALDAGWNGSVYVANSAAGSLATWGPARAHAKNLAARGTIELDEPAYGRFVLVWATLLPPSGVLRIAEVRVVP